MRTNIDINDDLMDDAMRAGAFKTKKDAVEAGLKLLARQAAYREVLKWEGKLQWEGDEDAMPLAPPVVTTGGRATRLLASEPAAKKTVTARAGHGRR